MVREIWWLLVGLLFCLPYSSWAKNTEITVATEADDVVTRILFDALAEHFSLDVRYIHQPSFDEVLHSVASGQTDYAANVTFTPERDKLFSYSYPTNIEYTYLYSFNESTLDDVSVVGVPDETIYSELIAANYPHIKQVSYQGHEQAFQLLETGAVDGVVDAINQLKPMLLRGLDAQLLNHQISIKPVSIVSAKGQHEKELAAFAKYIHSEAVQKRIRDEISEYQFSIRKRALQIALASSRIDLNQPLTIKLEPIFPYVIYHPDGRIDGITADVVQQSCQILALNCQIVSHANETWGNMLGEFTRQEVDMIAPLTYTSAREQIAQFTVPHYAPQSVMVKRIGYKEKVYSHVSQLIAEKIGVVKDDFFDALLSQMLPLKELVRYRDRQQMVEALLRGEVDYIAMDTATLNYLLRTKSMPAIEQDDAIGVFHHSKVSIGLANNSRGRELAPYFSKAIQMLDLDAITERYDLRPNWRSSLQMEQLFASRTQALFTALFLFVGLISFYLYRQSNTDNLTGLGNRRSLVQKYGKGIPGDLTVLYIDLNQFKPINDTYGHHSGDMVLKRIGQQIRQQWSGKAFRVGGDEFILIGKIAQSEVENSLQRFSRFVIETDLLGMPLVITASVGISRTRKQYMSLQQALHLADVDMYQNKHQQREMGYS
ncbi:GGDEF domain-containing protein [Vibrio navarrensis]|nr:GGDEF domain-containing protein [Vibrio navarrensis]EKA5636431.1 transporter substrate-binding domain-containing protein [Vibrio navarrensis]